MDVGDGEDHHRGRHATGRTESGGAAASLARLGHCPLAVSSGAQTRMHTGKVNVFYDPLEQQWFGWWSCCGAFARPKGVTKPKEGSLGARMVLSAVRSLDDFLSRIQSR